MNCPACDGTQLAGHPAGWLAFQHRVTCPHYEPETRTHYADAVLGSSQLDATRGPGRRRTWSSNANQTNSRGFTRPSTSTERALLEALGYEIPEELADNLRTTVRHLTAGTIRREWPDLEP